MSDGLVTMGLFWRIEGHHQEKIGRSVHIYLTMFYVTRPKLSSNLHVTFIHKPTAFLHTVEEVFFNSCGKWVHISTAQYS